MKKILSFLIITGLILLSLPIAALANEESQTESTVESSEIVLESTEATETTIQDETELDDSSDTSETTETSDSTETPPEEIVPNEPPEDTPPDMATMKASAECINFIKLREGFVKYPAWDYSQWTVGYGTRCPDDKLAEYKKNGITEAAALELLASMMVTFENAVRNLAIKNNITLTQNQFDALVSFSFNCGTAWTYKENYVSNAVISGATGSEFTYAMCLWSKAGGDFILTPRRIAETNIYLSGTYPASNSAVEDNYRYVYLDAGGGTLSYYVCGFDTTDPVPVTYNFKSAPTGVDKKDVEFTYEFAGWYTTDNTKVEILDENIEKASILYAKWKNPSGEIVQLSNGTPITPENVTVTSTVNIRSGPGTHYPSVTKIQPGAILTVTEIYEASNRTWGKCEQGWIALSYTDYGTEEEVPEVFPRPGVVNATNVNVRSSPGMSGERQYQMNTGDKVTIYEKVAADGLEWGKLEDGNWICLTYVTLEEITNPDINNPTEKDPDPPADDNIKEPASANKFGDIDKDSSITKDDSIYLLRHVLFPDKYKLEADGDIDKSGTIDKDDAIYLLRHVLFPDKYPLN